MQAEFWTTRGSDDVPSASWQRMLSATHLPWIVRVPDGSFEAWVQRWWIDDLALVDCECGPCSGVRARGQLAATDGEYLAVLITRGGRESVEQDGAQAQLRPGDAVVWDSARPARFAVWEPLVKRSLFVPRAALDELGGVGTVGAVRLDGDAPATRLLTAYLDALRPTLPLLGPAAVTAARNATLQLFVGALHGEDGIAGSEGARPALRAAMDRYIERHLRDAVTAASVADAHGVSIRTVNRIFNAAGQTVGEVVRARRLAHARAELAAGEGSVAAIAHRWGFADSSHFSRSFKAHYGSSPTEYREAIRAGGASVHPGDAVVHAGARPPAETGPTTTASTGD